MRVRKAIIPAAGLGTRFLPAIKAMPKEISHMIWNKYLRKSINSIALKREDLRYELMSYLSKIVEREAANN